MLKYFWLFLLSSGIGSTNAQTEQSPLLKKMGSQFGVRNTITPGMDYTIQDLRELQPNSSLLNQDFSDFNKGGPSVQPDNIDFEFLLKYGIRNKHGEYSNARIRIGASIGYSYDFDGFLNQNETINLDTFSNAQSQFVSIDSFHSRSYSLYQGSNQFNLHCSYIINSNPGEKINMFLGLGMNMGILFNRSSGVDYFESRRKTKRTTGFNQTTQTVTRYPTLVESESFSEKSLFQLMPFISLGFNYQIHLVHPFWRKVYLGYELRPSARFLNHRLIGKKKMVYANHGLTINYRI